MKKKLLLVSVISLSIILLIGCSSIKSKIKDYSAELIGLEREFHVYDDDGNETLFVKGDNTDMQASEVDNVLLIEVDGSRWQHVGSTLIAYESGITNYVNDYKEALNLSGDNKGTITAIDSALNQFVSGTSGLKRIIIVKTQNGIPVAVFDGDKVLIEESSLPNTTKVLIDGKRLHIYRADLEIIEKSLLK